MKPHQLTTHLDRVARRLARDRVLRRTALACAAAAAAALALWTVWTQTEAAWIGRHSASLFSATALSLLLAALLLRARRVDRHTAARAVEQQFPDLNQRLLAALEQQPSVETGRLSFLQDQVVGEALAHAKRNNWLDVVPASRLALSAALQFAGLGLFAAAVSLLWLRPPVVADVDRAALPASALLGGGTVDFSIAVEPGDAEIERGTDLLVLARFDRQLPAEAALLAAHAGGKPTRIPLARSLDDPLFGGRLTEINSDTTYRVEYDDQQTREYRVTVFDYPAIERLDAVIGFPEYTALPETTLADTRRVSVVEGSQITLIGHANKPVAAARLIDENETAVEFAVNSSRRDRFALTLTPVKSQRYVIELDDDKGRHNKFPEEFIIEVTPNRRPDLKLTFPAKDLRVSPLEELSLEASAWDDYGIQQYGLIYALAGQEPTTLVLGEDVPGREQRDAAHLLSFEKLAAEPDQLLSYYFFADDYGPDGRLRRTYSDMFFAEVRHFEEIFREGQQPPGGAGQQQGGGSPQSQQIEELAKLQKEIVNATWNVIRRETADRPGETFAADVQLIAESQQSALDQLHKLAEKLDDPKSQALVAGVTQQMTAARDALQAAADHNDADRLSSALSSEQAAYQGLLKLRAREHKVSQSKSGGGGGGGGSSRSEQQMNQLELTNKENRYQTESSASADESSPADREQLQVLNRLRELARRQQGLNEKLKELENALREAKTEQEQEEIRRRLKRLRDEQQEMLRDVDELRNRMDRPQNQQQMADDRRKLDQTREQIRQTSEALEQNQLSQALNSGTRTERDLNQLKEDFRKRTAGRFADEMKDLRDKARTLSEKQGELAEQMKSLDDSRRRTLRDSGQRRQIARGLEEQKQSLDHLLDRAKDVIHQADETEPLLSRKLYDTVRRARDDRPGEQLEAASQLVDKGLAKDAEEARRQAARGIENMRNGIEQAAESVLGSEAESLRTAQKELDDVAKALQNELAQAANQSQGTDQPQGAGPRNPTQTADASSPASNPGNPQSNNPQSAIQNPQSPSEPSPSGQQPGGQSPAGGGQPSENSQSAPQPSTLSSQPSTGGLSGGPGDHGGGMKPLTGDDFRQWSDKLRDVEEMVEDPQIKGDVARIRDRARSMRVEFKRHSKEPNWDLVRVTILEPLVELQQQLAEEIARRESPDALVPIDRDPVPDRFTDLVEKYYQRLGQGRRTSREETDTPR